MQDPDIDDLASTCKSILLNLGKKSTCKDMQVPSSQTCWILLKTAYWRYVQILATCCELTNYLAWMDSLAINLSYEEMTLILKNKDWNNTDYLSFLLRYYYFFDYIEIKIRSGPVQAGRCLSLCRLSRLRHVPAAAWACRSRLKIVRNAVCVLYAFLLSISQK